MRGYLAAFLSALLALALVPAPASGAEEACAADFRVMQMLVDESPLHLSTDAGPTRKVSSGCALLLPTTTGVYAAWWNHEPGQQGLVALVEGEGFEAFRVPVEERPYGGTTTPPTVYYATETFPLPEGLAGALRVTLLQDDVPIRASSLGPVAA